MVSVATPEALLCAPTLDLPLIIRTAIARVADFAELDPQEQGLLTQLLRCVSVRTPDESVRIRNSTLAEKLHMCERSVQRVKARLEEKGWITRHQVQSRRLGMQISDVWLTEHALEALGLRRTKKTDALLTPQSLTEKQPMRAFEKELPEDLAPLQSCDISVPGIRKLMGVATRAGHRLGDIVRMVRERLEQVRTPFSYLLKLIRSPRDWSAQAAAAQKVEAAAAEASSRAQARDDLLRAIGDGMLSHEKRRYVWRVFGGVVHQSTVEDAASSAIGRWLPLQDFEGVSEALRAGKLFRVDKRTIEDWASSKDSSLKSLKNQ